MDDIKLGQVIFHEQGHGWLEHENIHVEGDVARKLLAAYFLAQMIQIGGNKEVKVKAAFEYADLIMKG